MTSEGEALAAVVAAVRGKLAAEDSVKDARVVLDARLFELAAAGVPVLHMPGVLAQELTARELAEARLSYPSIRNAIERHRRRTGG